MILFFVIISLAAICIWFGCYDAFINFRYVVSVLLGIFGILIIFLNLIPLVAYIKDNKHVSGIPLLGGLSLCMAIAIFPNNPYAWLCWVALIIDFQWGIPGILYSVLKNMKKNKKDS